MSADNSDNAFVPIAPHYDGAQAEAHYTQVWDQAGYAKGDPTRPGKSFSVVIPPPNVTGSLHMGHALNNTLQDVLVRYHRMDGDNVVWVPGFDHASIAVHWLLERQLREEGTSREALGREAFLKRAWAFKERHEANIVAQQRRLGLSCDWERQRFTLDAGLSEAVREAFVALYEDGLIYRANRLVNWDPVTRTSVSDLEVVYEENVAQDLVHFAYPLASGAGELVVATTRPETMLGDTAVAVHPEDSRYAHLIGQMLDSDHWRRHLGRPEVWYRRRQSDARA
jgi:valyl-tRNA synthetase